MNKLYHFIALLLVSGSVSASGGAHWGYSGGHGPDHWAQLTPENSACAGKNQSPVDLTGFVEADLQPIVFHYQNGGHSILNNGHTVQVNYAKGSNIVVDGQTFNLLQFHFHAPSENHIEGKSFPLEAHLVHADKAGNLAVVAVMFEAGAANATLAQAWQHMPQQAGDEHTLSALHVDGILPEKRAHYRFNGSLTTPPCSEGVRWLVMKASVSASAAQIKTLVDVLHHANNRPLQAQNARVILQ